MCQKEGFFYKKKDCCVCHVCHSQAVFNTMFLEILCSIIISMQQEVIDIHILYLVPARVS